MIFKNAYLRICIILLSINFFSLSNAEEDEIYLKAVVDQIQVITQDLKTLEKAVYQKSDISITNTTQSSNLTV